MMLILILPWFPIALGASLGARLVGSKKAWWVGITCALFWVIIVQMTTNTPFWADAPTAASLLAGAAAIFGLASWSGQESGDWHLSKHPPQTERVTDENGSFPDRRKAPADYGSDVVTRAVSQFDDWLECHRFSVDAWSAFDEFIRGVLFTSCDASHVRPYRILSEGDQMLPMRGIESVDHREMTSSRRGILGHVATSARSYYADDPTQGDLVAALAQSSPERPVWCFAIRRASRTVGIVSVGQLGSDAPPRPVLSAVESLVSQFWTTLTEVCRSHSAIATDAVSGLLTREAFFDDAQRAAEESYHQGEPIALAVIAVEGLRTLVDEGRWDLANDVVHEVCKTLRQRVRPDDVLGRFDDARFLILLRRVDSELASLIAMQLADRLMGQPVIEGISSSSVDIRCGVTGSGNRTPAVLELVTSAIALCHRARACNERVATDLGEIKASSGSVLLSSVSGGPDLEESP